MKHHKSMAKKAAMGKKSAPQNTAVGSGSRPNGGRVKIMSSAPKNDHTLDRDTSYHSK